MAKKKKVLSKEEKAERKARSDHKRFLRGVFRGVGFERISSLSDKEFSLENGVKSDFDDVFVFENLIVFVEYTTSKSSNVGSHIKGKQHIYNSIESDPEGFVDLLSEVNQDLKNIINNNYDSSQMEVVIVYASKNEVDPSHKLLVPFVVFLDYPELRYFYSLVDAIKYSAIYEVLEFLRVKYKDLGKGGAFSAGSAFDHYEGLLLPHGSSSMPKGYKIVSFYIDPAALLRRAFVLRRHGWKHANSLYQRMLSKSKLEGLRKYLKNEGRVFANNIIVSLPSNVDIKQFKDGNVSGKAQPVRITIPEEVNTVGLIDGQHRTYCYYQTKVDDQKIAKLRDQQNLLVTGFVFPENVSDKSRQEFEARLFREINDNQTKVKSDLIHAIELVLRPYSDVSLATKVLERLNEGGGPLGGEVEQYFFDKDKLKTASVVSYGLKPLVKAAGVDSVHRIWVEEGNAAIDENSTSQDIRDYTKYAAKLINDVLAAVRDVVGAEYWTADKKSSGRMLTTTKINAILILLRLLIEGGHKIDYASVKAKLNGLSLVDFEKHHSSRYRMMAKEIYEQRW